MFRPRCSHLQTKLIQIKYLQCAYNMGSHNVYNYDMCVIQTTVKKYTGG